MLNGRIMISIAVISVAMATGNAQGITITLDPGPLGNAGTVIPIDFDDLNGVVLSGQTLDLDLVWDFMKHIEVSGSIPFITTDLQLFHSPVNNPIIPAAASGFLSDENGDLVLAGIDSGGSAGPTNSSKVILYRNILGSFKFHDVHIQLPTPNTGATITGARLRLVTNLPTSDPFIIGGVTSGSGAVPEPITATLGLMGLGVLGLATRRRAA